jgi:hypothetical protein
MTSAEQPGFETSHDFHSGAARRIRRLVVVLAVAGAAILLPLRSWIWALGFVLGAAVAYVNMIYLEQTAGALARAGGQGTRSSALVAAGYLARFTMVAAAAYAIFEFSRVALYGFVGGLFVPVGAMICEAGYEVWYALRRG